MTAHDYNAEAVHGCCALICAAVLTVIAVIVVTWL